MYLTIYIDLEPGSRDTGAGAGIIVRKSLSYCWKSGTWDRGLNIGCTQVRHYTLHYLVSSWACSAACCSGDVLAAEVEEQTGLFLRWDERGAEEHVMLQSALTNTCPDLVLPARCWVRTQDVQCSNTSNIHSMSEILPVYEVLTIMQDIGYWKHELLGWIIYGISRYKWVYPLHCCVAIWMVNTEPFIILYCMWRKYIEWRLSQKISNAEEVSNRKFQRDCLKYVP